MQEMAKNAAQSGGNGGGAQSGRNGEEAQSGKKGG